LGKIIDVLPRDIALYRDHDHEISKKVCHCPGEEGFRGGRSCSGIWKLFQAITSYLSGNWFSQMFEAPGRYSGDLEVVRLTY